MSIQKARTVRYYYDSHPTEEDLMGESDLHDALLTYLKAVLRWLFREEGWFIPQNLNIYETIRPKERPVAPDLAVYKGIKRSEWPEEIIRSWSLALPGHPPPAVVFEIASDETWPKNINEKPGRYARMGVKEYFFYDPRPGTQATQPRLRGWKMVEGLAVAMELNERCWLWSEELESWLVPDGKLLRLLDRIEQQRLTPEEAEQTEKEAALAQAAAEREAKVAARLEAEAERAAKESAQEQAEAERAAKEAAQERAEAERAAKERAWALLREHGIEPEDQK